MTLKKLIISSFSVMALGNILLAVIIFHLAGNQGELNRAYENRYLSSKSADELRQSSDDLTRLARAYVVSGQDKYEKMYWDVLAIRNGEKPRPEHYERIYWDFVLEYGDKPRSDDQKITLQQIMQNLGFTDEEFSLLTQAQQNSDSLVTTETKAMHAMKGQFDDGRGNYTVIGEPDYKLAQRIMHDNKYHDDKYKIMLPIDTFLRKLDERTSAKTQSLKMSSSQLLSFTKLLVVISILLIIFLGFYVSRFVYKKVGGDPSDIEQLANEVAKGNLDIDAGDDEKTGIFKAVIQMSHTLKSDAQKEIDNSWLKESSVGLSVCMRGDQELDELGQNICTYFAKIMGAAVGGFYISNDDKTIKLKGCFALAKDKFASIEINEGEGLIGQVMVDKELSLVTDLPDNYMQIQSGIMDGNPRNLLIFPFIVGDKVEAVIELGTIDQFSDLQLDFLKQEAEGVAINVSSARARSQLKKYL